MAKGALADDSKKNLSLLLSGATGTISIEPAHDSARPDARVSFALSESSAARWLDEDGNSGVFNPQRIVSDWDNITDAGRVRLGLALEDGTDRTIIISDVRIRRHNGLIQFIGSLLSVDEAKRIRSVVGAESNIEHRVFVEGISQNGVELAFSDADLFLDTYTLNDYRQTSRGVDRGIPLREILGDRSTDSPLQGRPDKTYQESSDHNQLLPLSTNEPLPYRSTLPGFSQLSEHTIKAAFRYAQKHGTMFSPDDPIFGYDEVMPAGSARQSDQASKGLDGRIYELNISHPPAHPISLANQAFGLGEGGQSLDLSFDFDYASYGYIYVPSGVWDKLKPSEYSAATFVALQAGPSVNLVPGAADGEFRIGEKSLLTKEFYSAGNYGSVRVESSLKAGLHAKLDTNNMSADRRYRGELYPIIGILVTYNTGQGSGIHVDASYGLAKDFEAFDVLTGINLSPRLTAALDVAWGLFTPSSTPYIGRQTVFDFALASRNSFDLNLQLSKIDNPSLTFGASGRLT